MSILAAAVASVIAGLGTKTGKDGVVRPVASVQGMGMAVAKSGRTYSFNTLLCLESQKNLREGATARLLAKKQGQVKAGESAFFYLNDAAVTSLVVVAAGKTVVVK